MKMRDNKTRSHLKKFITSFEKEHSVKQDINISTECITTISRFTRIHWRPLPWLGPCPELL
jgi:hypothetical protein